MWRSTATVCRTSFSAPCKGYVGHRAFFVQQACHASLAICLLTSKLSLRSINAVHVGAILSFNRLIVGFFHLAVSLQHKFLRARKVTSKCHIRQHLLGGAPERAVRTCWDGLSVASNALTHLPPACSLSHVFRALAHSAAWRVPYKECCRR